MYALNFYSPVVAEQLRNGRKSATIRLGDKSGKYRKGMVVRVLCGVRFSPREHVFDAVIDRVEVKTLGELSPREIEHDNHLIRRTDEMASFLSQLYNREVGRRRSRHRDPLLADHERPRRSDLRERPLLSRAQVLRTCARALAELRRGRARSSAPPCPRSRFGAKLAHFALDRSPAVLGGVGHH